MIDLNELSEYALEVIKRLAAEDEKAQKKCRRASRRDTRANHLPRRKFKEGSRNLQDD